MVVLINRLKMIDESTNSTVHDVINHDVRQTIYLQCACAPTLLICPGLAASACRPLAAREVVRIEADPIWYRRFDSWSGNSNVTVSVGDRALRYLNRRHLWAHTNPDTTTRDNPDDGNTHNI